jgi:hypothetical protein
LNQIFQICVAKYANIIETTEHEDCATYSLFPFLLIQVFQILNDYGAAITALATLVIAGFTGTLWKATSQQARLTRKAIELANKEFVSTNRPRIRVRRVILKGTAARYGAEHLSHGNDVAIGITLFNVGGTIAHIVDSRYRI